MVCLCGDGLLRSGIDQGDGGGRRGPLTTVLSKFTVPQVEDPAKKLNLVFIQHSRTGPAPVGEDRGGGGDGDGTGNNLSFRFNTTERSVY